MQALNRVILGMLDGIVCNAHLARSFTNGWGGIPRWKSSARENHLFPRSTWKMFHFLYIHEAELSWRSSRKSGSVSTWSLEHFGMPLRFGRIQLAYQAHRFSFSLLNLLPVHFWHSALFLSCCFVTLARYQWLWPLMLPLHLFHLTEWPEPCGYDKKTNTQPASSS